MSVSYDPNQDRYFVAPQSGPYAMGYGNFTVPSTYGGDGSTIDGSPTGPFFATDVRERMRDFYANGVQGGSPAGKMSQRTDAVTESCTRPPFMTSAINYWGDLDPFRERPYDVLFSNTPNGYNGGMRREGILVWDLPPEAKAYDAFGHYVSNSCMSGRCGFDIQSNGAQFFASPPQTKPSWKQPLMVLPIPAIPHVKTIESLSWPGDQNVCISKI